MKRGRILAALCGLCIVAAHATAGDRDAGRAVRHIVAVADASAPPTTPFDESERAATIGAIHWRFDRMKDEFGQIPPNARYEANARRRASLQGNSGHGTSVGGATISTTTSAALTTWVTRGPRNVGGRTRSLIINPTNPSTLYAGSVSGGIWKSLDGGSSWASLDSIANLNVQTMVMDPLNPQILYAGTGETIQYADSLPGDGILKSIDAGLHWDRLPSTATTSTQDWTRVSALSMQPGVSGVLLCAKSDGVWRSADSGGSWTLVLSSPNLVFKAISYVAFDPNNGQNAIAAVPGDFNNGIIPVQMMYSTSYGVNWSAAAIPAQVPDNNLRGAWGSQSIVYMNIAGADVGSFEIWRSDNAGQTYVRESQQSGLAGCTPNQCAIWVSPANSQLVVVGGQFIYRSTNSGVNFSSFLNNPDSIASGDPHVDIHNFVSDPTNASRVYVCTDGGVYRTDDISSVAVHSGWVNLNSTYVTTQFDGGAGRNDGISWPLIGGTQDNGFLRVFEYDHSLQAAGEANQMFYGDGFHVAFDPIDSNYVYGRYFHLSVYRSTNGGETNSMNAITDGLPPISILRAGPLVMDPNDRNTLWNGFGSGLYRTVTATSGVPHWDPIDMSGGFSVVAIAVAKLNSNIVWLGSGNGQLLRTSNGLSGSPQWQYVEDNATLNHLPDRTVQSIFIDPGDANVVYVAFAGYTSTSSPQPANLWRTIDGGVSWSAVGDGTTGALPHVPIWSVARHPRNRQYLWAATDIGIYESQDLGTTWATSQQGPGDVSVDDLEFVQNSELLLAATHGRGLWTGDTSFAPTFSRPSGLIATATVGATNSVTVTWNALSGAGSYQVMRSSDGVPFANATNGAVSGSPFTDQNANLVAGKTYLYRVKASVNGVWTDLSDPDLATIVSFTDDGTLTGKSFKANYLNEARDAANDVMVAAGETGTFAHASVGTPVRASDITDLRAALVKAYALIGMPTSPPFAESITQGSTAIKGSHLQEIRNAVK